VIAASATTMPFTSVQAVAKTSSRLSAIRDPSSGSKPSSVCSQTLRSISAVVRDRPFLPESFTPIISSGIGRWRRISSPFTIRTSVLQASS